LRGGNAKNPKCTDRDESELVCDNISNRMTDPDLLDAVRKLKPAAVQQLLHEQAPQVYRLAYALAGRWDVGRGIARFVLNRSVRMMPKWKPEEDPANWFHRFTIMVSRRSAKHRPAAGKDVLIEQALSPDQKYVAFIAALRQLETQQREAFLLRVGEKLNERYSALAMDCSTKAVETHLIGALRQLKLVAGEDFEPVSAKLADAYMHLTPESDQLVPQVSSVVFRRVSLRRCFKLMGFFIAVALLALIAWAGWKLWHMIQT
jgi:DNA-directed RNA polymerase specialized sigma24 family protein